MEPLLVALRLTACVKNQLSRSWNSTVRADTFGLKGSDGFGEVHREG